MTTAGGRREHDVGGSAGPPHRPRRARLTVALVGADGAGKSTVSGRLREVGLPRPVEVVYMGVNLEASTLMLPTTRLLLAAKKARGRPPDLTAGPSTATGSWRESLRLSVWIVEEWLRVMVATSYSLRGRIVIFDRHFFADYYADVHQGSAARSRVRRLHGWMLQHAYPKPDLTIVLDAPADRLYARKPEATVAWLEGRRREYLDLAAVVPGVVVLDADRPVDAVVAEAAELIRTCWKSRS